MSEHKGQPKIAVYAIAKNEAAHVARFAEGCAGADGIFVLDTGSNDGTLDALHAAGIVTGEFKGDFAFDAARNQALALVPDDFEIRMSLDIDEVPGPGWAENVRAAWVNGVNHLSYLEWCGTAFISKCNIHGKGFHWRYPIHEALYPVEGTVEKTVPCDIIVRHMPDEAKSRAWYLDALAAAVKAMPADERMAFYHARELRYRGRHAEAVEEFQRYLRLPTATWPGQRADAMGFIAQSCIELRQDEQAEGWLLRTCAELPGRRQGWLDLGGFYLKRDMFPAAHFAGHHALAVKTRNLGYSEQESAWKEGPHDLIATAAWYLGLKVEARKHVNIAFHLAPTDKRIRENHRKMEGIEP